MAAAPDSAAQGAAEGGIPTVPWPSSIATSAKAHLDALGASNDKHLLWEILGLAAGRAATTWHNAFDSTEDPQQSCELWLWITDALADRLQLREVPRSKWPVQLQLLGLAANDGCEDARFLTTAAKQLEQWVNANKKSKASMSDDSDRIKAVMRVAVIAHLHAVMAAACSGELKTLEALIGRVDECEALAKEWGWESRGGPSSQRLDGRGRRPRSRAQGEPVLAAVDATRYFNAKVTNDAFSMETTDEALGGTPLPPREKLLAAARSAQVDFPTVWIRDIAIEAASQFEPEAGAEKAESAGAAPASKRRRAG